MAGAVGAYSVRSRIKVCRCNVNLPYTAVYALSKILIADAGTAVQNQRRFSQCMYLFKYFKIKLRRPLIMAVRIPDSNGKRVSRCAV